MLAITLYRMTVKTRRGFRWGFTLVELLVVVAIIAILIAILIPSLSRAREQSKKAVCLSNMRQTFIGVKMYATEFNEVTPLGAWGNKQYNYLMYAPKPSSGITTARPVAIGMVHAMGYMLAGKAFYCPTNIDPLVMYDSQVSGTYVNPWRNFPLPNPDPYSANTRIGFGMRPMVNWLPLNPSPQQSYCPVNAWGAGSVNANNVNIKWPKLPEGINTAILADITPHYAGLLSRHKEGVNALFGHGGASWVPVAAFKKSLVGPGCPSVSENDPSTTFGNQFDAKMLDESVTPAGGFWGNLDSYH